MIDLRDYEEIEYAPKDPTEEEISECCREFEFNLATDSPLLWIIIEYLSANIPPNWKYLRNKKSKNKFIFYNPVTKQISKNHPSREYYFQLFQSSKIKLNTSLKRRNTLDPSKKNWKNSSSSGSFVLSENGNEEEDSMIYGISKILRSQSDIFSKSLKQVQSTIDFDYQSQISKMQQDHQNSMINIDNENKRKEKQLQEKHEKMIEDMKQQHRKIVCDLKNRFEREVKDIENKYQRRINDMKDSYKQQMQTIKQTQEQKIEQSQKHADELLSPKVQKNLSFLRYNRNEYQKAVERFADFGEQEKDRALSDFESEMENIRLNQQRQIAKNEESFQQVLIKQKQQHLQEIEKEKRTAARDLMQFKKQVELEKNSMVKDMLTKIKTEKYEAIKPALKLHRTFPLYIKADPKTKLKRSRPISMNIIDDGNFEGDLVLNMEIFNKNAQSASSSCTEIPPFTFNNKYDDSFHFTFEPRPRNNTSGKTHGTLIKVHSYVKELKAQINSFREYIYKLENERSRVTIEARQDAIDAIRKIIVDYRNLEYIHRQVVNMQSNMGIAVPQKRYSKTPQHHRARNRSLGFDQKPFIDLIDQFNLAKASARKQERRTYNRFKIAKNNYECDELSSDEDD